MFVRQYRALSSLLPRLCKEWSLKDPSCILEDASKRLEIAGIAGLLAQHPILCPPEEVCVQGNFSLGPSHTGVIVENDLLWQTAVHALSRRIGWSRDRLPRLCLSLGNHQFLPVRVRLCEYMLPSLLLPGTPAAIQV